jgi:hypothetical protein
MRVSGRPTQRPRQDQTVLIWMMFVVMPVAVAFLAAVICAVVSGTPLLLGVAFPLGGVAAGLVATSPLLRMLLPALRGYRTSCLFGLVICFEALADLLQAQVLPADSSGLLFRCTLLLLFFSGLFVIILPAIVRRTLRPEPGP